MTSFCNALKNNQRIDFSRQHNASLCVLVEMTWLQAVDWGEEKKSLRDFFSSPPKPQRNCHLEGVGRLRGLLINALQIVGISTEDTNVVRCRREKSIPLVLKFLRFIAAPKN